MKNWDFITSGRICSVKKSDRRKCKIRKYTENIGIKETFPDSGSNSDILSGERTEEFKAIESRLDLVGVFSRVKGA